MTTVAHLVERAGQLIGDGIRVEFAEEFDALVEQAKSAGEAVCIFWSRSDDGQVGYWGPDGVRDKAHWYGMGRPALGADKLVVMPVRVTEAQRAKFRALADGPDRLRKWLDRIR